VSARAFKYKQFTVHISMSKQANWVFFGIFWYRYATSVTQIVLVCGPVFLQCLHNNAPAEGFSQTAGGCRSTRVGCVWKHVKLGIGSGLRSQAGAR